MLPHAIWLKKHLVLTHFVQYHGLIYVEVYILVE